MENQSMKYLLGLFIAIFLINFAFAVDVNIDNSNKINLPQSDAYNFKFYIYNSTSGLIYPENLTCEFNIYNNRNLLQGTLTKTSPDTSNAYSFLMNGQNFSIIQDMSYKLYCNSSSFAIQEMKIFKVTPTGSDFTISTSIIISILGTFLVLVLMFFIGMFLKSSSITAKVIYFNIAYMISLSISFLVWYVADNFLYIIPFLGEFLFYVWFILMILILPEIIVSIAIILISNLRMSSQKRLGDMGYSTNEARRYAKR